MLPELKHMHGVICNYYYFFLDLRVSVSSWLILYKTDSSITKYGYLIKIELIL